MSKRHRKPTASAKEIAKIAVTAAGSQRADHAGSGGRCAGARAGYPLSAMPVEAQRIVRAGVLAFALGVGAVVANTPAVAFAEPTDTSSSSPSSDSSSSTSSSSSESAASTSSTDPTSSTTSSASASGSSSGSTSETVSSSVDSQTSSTSSPRHASTADPRSGVVQSSVDVQASSTSSPSDASTADPRSGVQSSGDAHTGTSPSSSDTTASAEATPTEAEVPSADAAASPDEPAGRRVARRETNRPRRPTSNRPQRRPPQSRCHRWSHKRPATPEIPGATAAAPPPDAPQGDSHTAPNSAGSALTNRSGSASSTSANQQSTVIDRAAATPASTAESRTATEAAVESVASIASAVADAPETQAVASAFSDPSAPPNLVIRRRVKGSDIRGPEPVRLRQPGGPGRLAGAVGDAGLGAPPGAGAATPVKLRANVPGRGNFRKYGGPPAAQPADE